MIDSPYDPLERLERRFDAARRGLSNEQFGQRRASWPDPLARLEHQIARGVDAARSAPPLTGLLADLHAASHLHDHAELPEASSGYDLFEALRSTDALKPKPALKTSPPPPQPPQPPPPPAASPERSAPARGAGGGVLAEVLLEALATRDLPGASRAEAARLLSQGIALKDDALLREALATLITGA